MKKIIILILFSMLLICCSCSDENEQQLVLLEEAVVTDEESESMTGTETVPLTQRVEHDMADEEAETAVPADICIHICGAVLRPGVYTAKEGARVCDLIECAGGMTEDAAADYLNQAAYVTDGQRICVPTLTEIREGTVPEEAVTTLGDVTTASADNTVININQATADQLKELPGVGDSRAQSIITYRESHGGFQTKEEIMQVDGIKEGMYSKMKDRISVD